MAVFVWVLCGEGAEVDEGAKPLLRVRGGGRRDGLVVLLFVVRGLVIE